MEFSRTRVTPDSRIIRSGEDVSGQIDTLTTQISDSQEGDKSFEANTYQYWLGKKAVAAAFLADIKARGHDIDERLNSGTLSQNIKDGRAVDQYTFRTGFKEGSDKGETFTGTYNGQEVRDVIMAHLQDVDGLETPNEVTDKVDPPFLSGFNDDGSMRTWLHVQQTSRFESNTWVPVRPAPGELIATDGPAKIIEFDELGDNSEQPAAEAVAEESL